MNFADVKAVLFLLFEEINNVTLFEGSPGIFDLSLNPEKILKYLANSQFDDSNQEMLCCLFFFFFFTRQLLPCL